MNEVLGEDLESLPEFCNLVGDFFFEREGVFGTL